MLPSLCIKSTKAKTKLSLVFAPHAGSALGLGLGLGIGSGLWLGLGLGLVIAFMRCGAKTEEIPKTIFSRSLLTVCWCRSDSLIISMHTHAAQLLSKC